MTAPRRVGQNRQCRAERRKETVPFEAPFFTHMKAARRKAGPRFRLRPGRSWVTISCFRLRGIGRSLRRQPVKHSGKCLDVRRVSIEEGAEVQQWNCLKG
jgi:hypothetical protein